MPVTPIKPWAAAQQNRDDLSPKDQETADTVMERINAWLEAHYTGKAGEIIQIPFSRLVDGWGATIPERVIAYIKAKYSADGWNVTTDSAYGGGRRFVFTASVAPENLAIDPNGVGRLTEDQTRYVEKACAVISPWLNRAFAGSPSGTEQPLDVSSLHGAVNTLEDQFPMPEDYVLQHIADFYTQHGWNTRLESSATKRYLVFTKP